MVVIEIVPNSNCEAVDLRIFNDAGAPRRIRQVRLERTPGEPAWCDVTGWTTDGTPCPAFAQRVDDSGEGIALLVYGGDAGLRLRPAGQEEPWQLEDASQWGEPFLLIGEGSDVR